MYFLLSGEGVTDMGSCADGAPVCHGDSYNFGPMAVLVSQIVEAVHSYCFTDTGHFGFVSEAALASRASELKSAKKSIGLPGVKIKKETRYFYNNARVMAKFANEKSDELGGEDVVAVLFRDSDGTASAGRGLWSTKRQSMIQGFTEEKLTRGVAMVPKPKSEAWLLFALKYKYQQAEVLENRPGNDHSPNSLKAELEDHSGVLLGEDLNALISSRQVDFEKMDMPSFHAFRADLEKAIG
jgi:hypothetical protein